MARLKGAPADLAMLKKGFCPDCGAKVVAGMVACPSCKLELGEFAKLLVPPAKPLTGEEIDALERGHAACTKYPVSAAANPEDPATLALGSGLLIGPHPILADAALADDVAVLAKGAVAATSIPRASTNVGRSGAASVDDAALLGPAPSARATAPAPAPTPPVKPVDPDRTVLHGALEIAGIISSIAAKGSARPLKE